jgi:sugar phosphate permease
MYMISYVDRTNVSLALDGRISSMLRDLGMDDRRKGAAAGIFFIGYVFFQVPGGYLAQHWSAKKLIGVCLTAWGLCAIAGGLARSYPQFVAARFFLGLAESAVFPATLVLLSHWFPSGERVRAIALWCLCQPLAVVVSAPLTGWCLGAYGWRAMLVMEGALPLLWLPIWWSCIHDYPRQAGWISDEERSQLEKAVAAEVASLEPPQPVSWWRVLLRWEVLLMAVIWILCTGEAYGCMTFFTSSLRNRNFTGFEYGILFAIPYLVTMAVMLMNSWHSDRTRERRGHVALVVGLSGACLIFSIIARSHFWPSYAFLCLAIPGPFAALGPFFAIPAEAFPRAVLGPVIGVVGALGNLGGFVGPYFVGWLSNLERSVSIPFVLLGVAMLIAAALSLLLPRGQRA